MTVFHVGDHLPWVRSHAGGCDTGTVGFTGTTGYAGTAGFPPAFILCDTVDAAWKGARQLEGWIVAVNEMEILVVDCKMRHDRRGEIPGQPVETPEGKPHCKRLKRPWDELTARRDVQNPKNQAGGNDPEHGLQRTPEKHLLGNRRQNRKGENIAVAQRTE